MAEPIVPPPGQARSRALMLATMMGLLAYVAPLAFAPYAVLSVWLLLLPPLTAWVAVDGGLMLRRRSGLPLLACTMVPPALVGLVAGWVDGAVMEIGAVVLTLWGLWTGLIAGLGAWLILRRAP